MFFFSVRAFAGISMCTCVCLSACLPGRVTVFMHVCLCMAACMHVFVLALCICMHVCIYG